MRRPLQMVTVNVQHNETEINAEIGECPSITYTYTCKFLAVPDLSHDEILARVARLFPAREEYDNSIIEFKTETDITDYRKKIYNDVFSLLKFDRFIPFWSDYEVA